MAGKGNTVSKVTEIVEPYAKELGLDLLGHSPLLRRVLTGT